jgi:hypothetical protein
MHVFFYGMEFSSACDMIGELFYLINVLHMELTSEKLQPWSLEVTDCYSTAATNILSLCIKK